MPGGKTAPRKPSLSIWLWQGKIAAAVYLYQVAGGGEWGEIVFDFESGKAEILRLANWDTVKTNRFAHLAISHILDLTGGKLPKETLLAF